YNQFDLMRVGWDIEQDLSQETVHHGLETDAWIQRPFNRIRDRKQAWISLVRSLPLSEPMPTRLFASFDDGSVTMQG
ncbi:UNVERIFIED_CONTAM: hypothetical protein NY603_41740, partial [Bacteroidetes bacterium 56_B9]